MKIRVGLTVILAVGLLLGAFASCAFSECIKIVKIVQVSSNDVAQTSVTAMDLYTVFPEYFYSAAIANTNPQLINAAQVAASSGRIVRITTNAEPCPTTGSNRYLGMILNLRIIK